MEHNNKKSEQLGMNHSTASGRLVKDVLWSLILETEKDICFRCGNKMDRTTFSIEHKEPWLDSEDPFDKFFDLSNIAFSHLSCNTKEARKKLAGCPSVSQYYERGCRCEPCRELINAYHRSRYSTEKRRERKKRTGH